MHLEEIILELRQLQMSNNEPLLSKQYMSKVFEAANK